MKSGVRELGTTVENVVTVSFGEKYAASSAFDTIFREGMALVEETAAYLDGTGRQDSKQLKGATTLAFATESMRLTTRLMQLASWLLIRKAVNEGEMSREDAREERRKVRFSSIGRPAHVKDFDMLPPRLQSLVERSYALLDRIARLDQVICGETPTHLPAAIAPQAANPLEVQHQRLHDAFQVHHLNRASGRT